MSDQTQAALEKSFAGAVDIADRYPQYAQQIIAAARQAFLDGDTRAYVAAILIVLIGAALVFFVFPKREAETALLAGYAAEDTGGMGSGHPPPSDDDRFRDGRTGPDVAGGSG